MEYSDGRKKDMFIKYETVRQSGAYNMFCEEARLLTGLTKPEYLYVMKNYNQLKQLYGGNK